MTMEIDALYAGQPMRNSLDPCNTCADWLALKAEGDALRKLLAVYVAGPMLYADDGELQDSSAMPRIDFTRDTPDEIGRKLRERALNRMSNAELHEAARRD